MPSFKTVVKLGPKTRREASSIRWSRCKSWSKIILERESRESLIKGLSISNGCTLPSNDYSSCNEKRIKIDRLLVHAGNRVGWWSYGTADNKRIRDEDWNGSGGKSETMR